jgi:hypothetical protein
MWCAPKDKCLRIWEEKCYADDIEEIRYLLAKKYSKQVKETTITARNKSADYLSVSVKFGAEGFDEPGEGGIVLAAKVDNVWTLVYDGNGSIDCPAIRKNYAFPDEFLTGYCD